MIAVLNFIKNLRAGLSKYISISALSSILGGIDQSRVKYAIHRQLQRSLSPQRRQTATGK
jgi:hypothetical protein